MLKNYTTSINIEKTISEIEEILAKHGASHIYKMYSNNGVPIALAFRCMVRDQMLSFKLPMREDKILMLFKNEVHKGKLPRRYFNDIDQARRTGWRIIKDWIDAQMALMEINLAKLEEIFLPYMYDEIKDQTLFEKMEKRDFNLQIEDKSQKVEPEDEHG